MSSAAPAKFTSPDDCVAATLHRVGKNIVLGLPVAIGKPNPIVNAFVRRAVADPTISLTIVTALSLRVPRWHSDLERRLLQPLTQRIFGNYPELEYVRLIEQQRLPANIEVIEFFLEPGAWLGNEHLQRHYLSSNYTHVVRDALRHGMNVVAQLVAPPPPDEMPAGVLSLGSNPDLTADLLPQIASMRASGQPFALIGQIHREMPFTYGDALVASDTFDFLVDDPATEFPLFCPPNTPIGLTEHAIALSVSTLLRDGGTLQLDIGELGDAIVYAAQLRHEQPAVYREVLESTRLLEKHRRLIETEGGTAPFDRGLYGCSEMLVDGFLDLYRSGILKRHAYPSARIQRLLDEGHIDETVGPRTLDALSAAGMNRMSYVDFNELRDVGVFRDDVQYERGMLIAPDGALLPASFDDPAHRAGIARQCLGERLRNGILVDAGFFFGPKAFYARLRELTAEERRRFAMRGISFVNELYGHEWDLKTAQRRHARFINTTMMVTGLGAAVSDGLADGRVVSGVGGQYNFVAMAHALAEARSILCLRATRVAKGTVASNIPWSYGHTTIPRHLRDIVVTEYGIAELRGKTDEDVVKELIGIMDARFQDAFVAEAQRAKKLPADYRVPPEARDNRPEILAARFARWREMGLFAPLPFGTDLTDDELTLAKSLKDLSSQAQSWSGRLRIAMAMLASPKAPQFRPLLERMALTNPASFRERIERRLVTAALRLGSK
ncbi:acetyl-CoA hydrolase/transferase C-terminal domain-containing protein [Povalibacter sp.]|uniref:acetyl-CoA hydrolase/transferase C-terminal domain-containing protein n=1 Tax=Povalibacter sp. TaxID=1962978 RepID=UPI002F426F01